MYYTELGSIEPFLESCPSLLIMIAIWTHAMWNNCNVEDCNVANHAFRFAHERVNQSDCNVPENYNSNRCAVFGGNSDSFSFAWFWITYTISALTGSLGITKLLMIGPCPILTDDGRLGGILTHFLAVTFSMGSKATFLGVFIGFLDEDNLVIPIMVFYILTIAPNIIFSFISIAASTGCNQKFCRIVLDYPSLWLLPAATFFVVGPENRALRENLCCNKSGKRSLLGVSSNLTFLNIILTSFGNRFLESFGYHLVIIWTSSWHSFKHVACSCV